MKYDLSNREEQVRAFEYFNKLAEKQHKVEIKRLLPARSGNQNSYVHVLFTLYGIEFGYTIEESKTMIKRNCHLMVYEKNGEKFLKSTAALDTKEMTDFIEWFRNFSSQHDCYLPSPNEYRQEQWYFDNEIDKHKQYL